MNYREDINKLFDNILGVKVILVDNSGSPLGQMDEKVFIHMITKWKQAWEMQDKLISEFGLLLEGYDGLLYEALETSILLSFSQKQAETILWYVYNDNEPDSKRILLDPKTLKEYKLETPKDLYDLIQHIESIDTLIDKEEGKDWEESDDDDES